VGFAIHLLQWDRHVERAISIGSGTECKFKCKDKNIKNRKHKGEKGWGSVVII
jgi:hypothetical protein